MIATDLARALDPVILARDCGIKPDDWQAELMRAMPRRALLCCSRQSGKSTCCALIALWHCLFVSHSTVVIASPSLRQSQEMYRMVAGFNGRVAGTPELRSESLTRCEWANGSRLLSLPASEKTVRGLTADLIIADEAARIDDELLAALRPMLATKPDSRFLALSTPAGRRGWFYESWIGDESWHRVRVPASECPRISQDFLDEELRELGAQRFAEEYQLEFLDATEAVFPVSIIEKAFTSEVVALWH